MRVALAVLLALHGLAHLVGFVGSWRLAAPETVPHLDTVLAGHVRLGDLGMRLMGVLWLAAAVAFTLASAGALAGREWWLPVAVGAAGGSLALTAIVWPEAQIGVAVNVAIVAALAAGQRWAWL